MEITLNVEVEGVVGLVLGGFFCCCCCGGFFLVVVVVILGFFSVCSFCVFTIEVWGRTR